MHREHIAHVLIPELSLAFVSQTPKHPYPYAVYRHLRLDNMADAEAFKRKRGEIKHYSKLESELIDGACRSLAEAKAVHDELEALYNPHVDFGGVRALAEKYAEIIAKRA